MNAARAATSGSIEQRVAAIDWEQVSKDLDAEGYAIIKRILFASECAEISGLFQCDDLFRSRVVMERVRFGRGEYKYFKYPLPDIVASLRTFVYPQLVLTANRWNELMRTGVQGAKSVYRVNLRHGVSRIRSGHRQTLGIIFHDAR